MSNSVDMLKNWFNNLPTTQQKEVVEFLYGGKALLQEGLYCGPHPGLVQKGLHCGPAPRLAATNYQASRVCPRCGRPV